MNKARILVVDDNPMNLDLLVKCLGEQYDIQVALDGEEALEAMSELSPDLVLLDVMMPKMDGFQVLERMQQENLYPDLPVILFTALNDIESKTRGFKAGAVDFVTKPVNMYEVVARVNTHLSLKEAKEKLKKQNLLLEEKVQERTRQLVSLQRAVINGLSSLAESRDPETGFHIQRTQEYMRFLGNKLIDHPQKAYCLTLEQVEQFAEVAPLHDIGKVGISDRILLKPGKLTAEEFEVMKEHTLFGGKALAKAIELDQSNPLLQGAIEIAMTHHEKWDGSGYPKGLRGEGIPLPGRLMALADVYDALICKRVYKKPIPHSKAVEIIQQGKGLHFDPLLTELFVLHHDEFRQIALRLVEFAEKRQSLRE